MSMSDTSLTVGFREKQLSLTRRRCAASRMQANTGSIAIAMRRNLIWPKVLKKLSTEGGLAMSATDYVRSLTTEILGVSVEKPQASERPKADLREQSGHHLPLRPEDTAPLDDTDRNSDEVIQPVRKNSPGP
jgi:hypothetical protein